MGKCEPKINPSTEKSLGAVTTTEKSKLIATTVEKLLASVSNASEKCMSFNLPNLDDVNDSVTFTAGNLLTGDGTEWVDLALGTASQLLRVNAGGTAIEWATVSGTGDVTGPGVATDEAIVRFNGTSGKIIQDYTGSAPTISDAGQLNMGGNAIDNVSLIDLNVGNAYAINSTDVLSFNTLGAGVVFSTLTTVGTITAGAWESSTDVGVAHGGTGASTAQDAIDTLTAVSGATNEHVLTKDTGSGNAIWKVAAAGSGDVTGPASSTADAIVRFNSTTGKIIQDYTSDAPTISDTGDLVMSGAVSGIETLGMAGDLTNYEDVIDANPQFRMGSSDAEEFRIRVLYDTSAKTIDSVDFLTDLVSGTADKGEFRFYPDQSLVATVDDGGIELATAKSYYIDTSIVLSETSLGSSVVSSSLTSLGTIATGAWEATDVGVLHGGTGRSTSTLAYGVLCAGTTATGIHQTIAALGSSGQVLQSNGAGALPTFETVAGTGDVVGDTGSVDKELVRFNSTTGKIIESPFTDNNNVTATLSDGADLTLYDAGNNTDPEIRIGANNTDEFHIATTYAATSNDLALVSFITDTSSAAAHAGQYLFNVDATAILNINDSGINVASGLDYLINDASVLNATTIGSAVVNSSLTSLGTIATGIWEADDVGVVHGGTGRSTSTTAYGVICAGTTATGVLQTLGALGSSGEVLTSGGAGTLPSWTTAGAGDVLKVGTPVNNELGVWTGDGTIEGDADLTWDATNLKVYNISTDGNPNLKFGAGELEELRLRALYKSGTAQLEVCQFISETELADADAGRFAFSVDQVLTFSIDDGGVYLESGNTYQIGDGTDVLSSNTLGTGVVTSSLTTVGTIGTGIWQSDDVGVLYGGTGRSAALAYSVVCGGISDTGAHQSVAALGSSGEVLTSQGAGALPQWTAAGSGDVTASGAPLINEIAVFSTATNILSDSTFSWNGTTFQATDTTIDAGGVDVATGDSYAINSVDVLTATVLGSSVVTSSLTAVGTLATGNATAVVDASSLTAAGKVELATAAEIDTGTDTTRAMGVDEYQASNRNVRYINIRVVEAATDVTTGTAVGGDFIMPFAGIVELQGTNGFVAFNDTAGITGTMTVDVNKNGAGTSLLSTKITIDTTEKTSSSAATPPVIDGANDDLVAGDIITIDVDGIHSGTAAKGLTVRIPVRRT